MDPDVDGAIRKTQEQAIASWVNYLNQVRLDRLLESLSRQDQNLSDALSAINEAIGTIKVEIVERNRGGLKGMHGFIAEVAEKGVGNARSRILGGEKSYEWINDNSPVDLLRNGVGIQQKFSAAGGSFSLRAVTEHLRTYPDFVTSGGKYQLPKDHFEAIRRLHDMPAEQAGLLSRSRDGLSFRDWQKVQDIFKEGELGIDVLEPSKLRYDEVQRGVFEVTLESEKDSLRTTDAEQRDQMLGDSMPNLGEAAKVTAGAAAVEGGVAFALAVISRVRAGKSIRDFSSDDWSEIAQETGFSAAKGAVRGLSIYALTNFTATAAATANSLVTASFVVAEQAHQLRSGHIDEPTFIENCQAACIETAVSALSSLVGQGLIPVPMLGAVIGNAVGMAMLKAATSALSVREAELIEGFLEEQRLLDAHLTDSHRLLLEQLEAGMADYLSLLEMAFSPNVHEALLGSVALAEQLGVARDELLDAEDKALAYFLL